MDQQRQSGDAAITAGLHGQSRREQLARTLLNALSEIYSERQRGRRCSRRGNGNDSPRLFSWLTVSFLSSRPARRFALRFSLSFVYFHRVGGFIHSFYSVLLIWPA